MAASSLAAARAALLRVAYSTGSATSSRPVPASAVLAARAAMRRLAHSTTAAAPSSSPVSPSAAAAASRVTIRWLEDKAAGAARSPPTATVAVVRALIRGLAHKAATAFSSPSSSSTALLWSKTVYHTSSHSLSSSATATPTPPSAADMYPRNVQYMIDLLDGLVLTTEEEKQFRKTFNEKFYTFKVADVLSFLEQEEFTVEEYCFLLKLIYAKLGDNKVLAALVVHEDIDLSPTSDDMMRNPQLSRVECKIDVLTKKFDKVSADILNCVRESSKGEWGTVEVYGKKFDLTKLEYVRELFKIIFGI